MYPIMRVGAAAKCNGKRVSIQQNRRTNDRFRSGEKKEGEKGKKGGKKFAIGDGQGQGEGVGRGGFFTVKQEGEA